MMNELTIVENIDKRLRAKNPISVFPLTPTHRKELRLLKSKNIGNLTDRLDTIKKLKRAEYKEKYFLDAKNQLIDVEKSCALLNNDWLETIKKINKILKQRENLESQHKSDRLSCTSGYGSIANLNEITDADRRFSYNEKSIINEICKKDFDEKFSKPFSEVRKRIDDINTKYEEAINFGDLEIVKELYYTMKSADVMFIKIEALQI